MKILSVLSTTILVLSATAFAKSEDRQPNQVTGNYGAKIETVKFDPCFVAISHYEQAIDDAVGYSDKAREMENLAKNSLADNVVATSNKLTEAYKKKSEATIAKMKKNVFSMCKPGSEREFNCETSLGFLQNLSSEFASVKIYAERMTKLAADLQQKEIEAEVKNYKNDFSKKYKDSGDQYRYQAFVACSTK